MKLFLFSFALLLSGAASGHASAVDSTAQPGVAFATALYQQARQGQTNLYSGIEHLRPYPVNVQGHPFFGEDEWGTGTVHYNGILYSPVSLRYDLTIDRLVVQHPDSAYRVALVPQNTRDFTLNGQTFIYLREADAAKVNLSPGFYHRMYEAKSQLLVRRRKELRSEVSRTTINNWFEPLDQYYLRLNGKYHPIKSKNAVLSLMGENKKGLLRHWRDKKIRFRRNRETALVEAARYFDTLNP